MHYLPIASTLVTFAFAIAVFNRFNDRHGAHLLLWGIGLVLYGIGTLTELISLFTFSPIALKLWYLCGAMLTAAWLGQGTINLLVRRRGITTILNVVMIVVSLLAVVLVMLAPITSSAAAFIDLKSIPDHAGFNSQPTIKHTANVIARGILALHPRP